MNDSRNRFADRTAWPTDRLQALLQRIDDELSRRNGREEKASANHFEDWLAREVRDFQRRKAGGTISGR